MAEVGLDYYRMVRLGSPKVGVGEDLPAVDSPYHFDAPLAGATWDLLGREPLGDCQSILSQNGTPLWVPLYLYSFTGGPSQVNEWVATGSVVFFGVSGLIDFPHRSKFRESGGYLLTVCYW